MDLFAIRPPRSLSGPNLVPENSLLDPSRSKTLDRDKRRRLPLQSTVRLADPTDKRSFLGGIPGKRQSVRYTIRGGRERAGWPPGIQGTPWEAGRGAKTSARPVPPLRG